MSSDLSAIHNEFYKAAQKRFSEESSIVEMGDFVASSSGVLPLLCDTLFGDNFPYIYEHVDNNFLHKPNPSKKIFCECVENEYKRFMVLKAIEALRSLR